MESCGAMASKHKVLIAEVVTDRVMFLLTGNFMYQGKSEAYLTAVERERADARAGNSHHKR